MFFFLSEKNRQQLSKKKINVSSHLQTHLNGLKVAAKSDANELNLAAAKATERLDY